MHAYILHKRGGDDWFQNGVSTHQVDRKLQRAGLAMFIDPHCVWHRCLWFFPAALEIADVLLTEVNVILISGNDRGQRGKSFLSIHDNTERLLKLLMAAYFNFYFKI